MPRKYKYMAVDEKRKKKTTLKNMRIYTCYWIDLLMHSTITQKQNETYNFGHVIYSQCHQIPQS